MEPIKQPFAVEASDGGVAGLPYAQLTALNKKINKLLAAVGALALLSLILLAVSIYAAVTAGQAKDDASSSSSVSSTPSGTQGQVLMSASSSVPDGYAFVAPLYQASGYWAEAPPLPVPALTDHATISTGASVYLLGGAAPANATEIPSADVWRFDSLLATFSKAAPIPTGPRYRAAAAAVGTKIYMTGGLNASDAAELQPIVPGTLVYDTVTDSWTQLAVSPSVPRTDACMSAVDGKLYLAGGYSQDYEATLSTVEVFDPVTATWTDVPDMPTPRGDLGCATLTDAQGREMLVVTGGYYDPTNTQAVGAFLTTVEAFTPNTSSWKTLAPMLHARGDKALARLPNNHLMVLGGETAVNNSRNQVASNKVAVYVSEQDAWVAAPPMPFGRFRFGAEYVDGLGVYVFGGATTSECEVDGSGCERRGGAETVLKYLTVEERTDVYLYAKKE